MRALALTTLLALIACGKANKDSDSQTTPTGPTTGTWVTGSGGSGTPGGTTGGSGSGGSGTEDTLTTYIGDADIDASTWTGTESARVLSAASGTLLCQWTWTAQDWASDPGVGTTPEPAVAPCVDEEGNACAFAFTVNLGNGLQTDGDCTSFGFDADGGTWHYGYAADWMRAGMSYGEQFAYYLPSATGGQWFPAQDQGYGFFSWTPATGTGTGTQPGQLHYEIEKTLLNAYTSP